MIERVHFYAHPILISMCTDWAFVDRRHPVETTCAVLQKYIQTRFAGFVRPNDVTGYDSLPTSLSNKELLEVRAMIVHICMGGRFRALFVGVSAPLGVYTQ